jgi:cytochrome c-type biogenesis protein CcmH/NrfG
MIKAKRRWGAALGFKILVRLTLLTIVLLLYYYSWFLLYG